MHKTIFLLTILFISFGTAQTISISGTVKDVNGNTITGAVVHFENSDISSTTDTKGTFELKGTISPVIHSRVKQVENAEIKITAGHLNIKVHSTSMIVLSVYNFLGQLVLNKKAQITEETHSIEIPYSESNIYMYKLTIGCSVYNFKSIHFKECTLNPSALFDTETSAFFKKKSASATNSGNLIVTCLGYLDYSEYITYTSTDNKEIVLLKKEGELQDVDGNNYQTVKIGNQIWTVTNLRTTRFKDGTTIQKIEDEDEWSQSTSPAYCYLKNTNDIHFISKNGALYNWHAAASTKIAPEGWHVPTMADWDTLKNYLTNVIGHDQIARNLSSKTDWKDAGRTDMYAPGYNLHANNSTGFSALPSAYRKNDSEFITSGTNCAFWSSTEKDTLNAGVCFMNYFYGSFNIIDSRDKKMGNSIRLVKN